MVSHLRVKPTEEFILNLINEAVEIERAFLNETIPFSLLNLTSKFVNQTIDKRALVVKLGLLKAFDTASKMKNNSSEKELAIDSENKVNQINKEIKFDEDF